MKKLTKAQEKARQRCCAEVEEKRHTLEEQIQQYNQTMAQEWSKLCATAAEVNEAIGSLNAFLDDVTDEMDGYLSERSEKWQESNAGTDYAAWKRQWEEARLGEVEIDEPAEIEMPEVSVDEVRDLPDSPA